MKKSIAIIGGGASALFFAATIDTNQFDVVIYEKNKTLGRKFLVAGDGGFNLTHSESIDSMIERYTPSSFLRNSLTKFDNNDFQKWLLDLDIPTFIGSSKRVYPEKGIKPIDVFNKVLSEIKTNGVEVKCQHEWKGWSNDQLLFNSDLLVKADIVVFGLGGASWKVTGSDGGWLSLFTNKGIKTVPFQSSNCAYKIDWEPGYLVKNEGTPLKNIEIHCEGKSQKGEVVITSFGMEGNAIYALSPEIRGQLNSYGQAQVFIDLKPSISKDEIVKRLNSSTKNRTKTLQELIKVDKVQLSLLKSRLSKDEFMSDEILANRIKRLPINISGISEIDKAISTVGGVVLSEVTKDFELKSLKNHYCIGEMLDWDAPTGGYLLQACYSMGRYLSACVK